MVDDDGCVRCLEDKLLALLAARIAQLNVEPRLCVVCGEAMSIHNTRDRCHKHGPSTSFDMDSGRCLICGETVSAVARGAHTLTHQRGGNLLPEEIKRRQRDATAKLRADRKSAGQCPGCGGEPQPNLSLCVSCAAAEKARAAVFRLARGQKPRVEKLLTHDGQTRTIVDWAKHTGIAYGVLWSRLRRGLPTEEVLHQGAVNRHKAVCVRGHALTGDNVYTHQGRRHCVACSRQSVRDRRAASRAPMTVKSVIKPVMPVVPKVLQVAKCSTPSKTRLRQVKLVSDAGMTPTRASVVRAEKAKRTAQGLERGDQRLRICKDSGCDHPGDVSLGGFQTPAGTVCARCGAAITAGRVVLVRSREVR